MNGSRLTHGGTRSCGCLRRDKTSQINLADLTGRRIGQLQVLERGENKGRQVRWKCRCDCGRVKLIASKQLLKGIMSCGCAIRAARKAAVKPDAPLRRIATRTVRSDIARTLGCDFSKEELVTLMKANCFYCQESGVRMGIDRLDSDKGYLRTNCVPCCPQCNYAKKDFTLEQFVEWLERFSDRPSPRERIAQAVGAIATPAITPDTSCVSPDGSCVLTL